MPSINSFLALLLPMAAAATHVSDEAVTIASSSTATTTSTTNNKNIVIPTSVASRNIMHQQLLQHDYHHRHLDLSPECQEEWDVYHADGTPLGDAFDQQILKFFTSTTILNPLDDDRCVFSLATDENGVLYSNKIECDTSTFIMDEDMEYQNACNDIGGTLQIEDVHKITCNMNPIQSSDRGIFTMIYPTSYRCYPPDDICSIEDVEQEYQDNLRLRIFNFEGEFISDSTQTNTAFLHGCAIGDEPQLLTLSPTSAPRPIPTLPPQLQIPTTVVSAAPHPWARPIPAPTTPNPVAFFTPTPTYNFWSNNNNEIFTRAPVFYDWGYDDDDDDGGGGFSGFVVLWIAIFIAFSIRYMRQQLAQRDGGTQAQTQQQARQSTIITATANARTAVAPNQPTEEYNPAVLHEINKAKLLSYIDANKVCMTVSEQSYKADSEITTAELPITKEERKAGATIVSQEDEAGGGDDDNDKIDHDIETANNSDVNGGWSIRRNQGLLILPIDSTTDDSATSTRTTTVSNCCAICLEPYKVNESVTWSSDRTKCQHAFHTDCIVSYLTEVMKKKDNADGKHLPCPICRETFLHLAEQ